ncbi:MAG TPA: hypothetical protein VI318_11270 [Baekduia sp.]
MRIGALFEPNSAANYRIGYPLAAMERRGHQILWPDQRGLASLASLLECDAVLIYRRSGAELRQGIRRMREAGVAVIWDNDDDFLHMPKNRRNRRDSGGRSTQQIFTDTMKTARSVDAVVVTTEPLAAVMADAGVPGARVIANHLMFDKRPARPHEGVVIGWIGGLEHRADALGVNLPNVLSDLMDKHPRLTVTTVGVELPLRDRARYDHSIFVEFQNLPDQMAGWDIGLAPLLDTPFNRSRSDIKLKEYAASRLPWVASPHGPYAGLGDAQGGRLAADDGWFDALDALISDPKARKRLSSAGGAWARRHTIDAVADEYETLFATAVAKASGQPVVAPRQPLGARLTRGLRRRVAAQ